MKNQPYLLGLTGSIGTGKSTTARMFADEGISVWDADATVRRLYSCNGAGVAAIAKLAPRAVRNGAVDRTILKIELARDPKLLGLVEAAVHPLVAQDRDDFIKRGAKLGNKLIVLDIPLLFETGSDALVDGVLVVTCTPEIQKLRLLQRANMSQIELELILKRQISDEEKRNRADYIIDTGQGMDAARQKVMHLIKKIEDRENNA